ncbi:hypothetical protein PFISCL1PPCAC_24867 [Pristionchus fissidentatus]|uniref:Uncharacterized protein n=1 Tax=Pristionchus fissidentatus TaxID=1538716 RepID=A0AAV5WUY5_9BILA|nr:hypothetical protein PFISCL1PPCAC_24864 [Pristionchus fissidentatus]GMT33570.1 hypothetical protein PFISCL1PPCAC_24867 [Pristionchus fissidentatus]
MSKFSLHFPSNIDLPNHETEVLFAPFALQTTVDGRALLALRFCTDSRERAFLQYFDMDTKVTSFYCLSDEIECDGITDMTVVNDRTIICGRMFDFAMLSFSDSSFSLLFDYRITPILSDAAAELEDNRTFALGATTAGDYVYLAMADEEDADHSGIKSFKVIRFDRSNPLTDKGQIVAHMKGCPSGLVWQNTKITVTDDGFIDFISRDLCRLVVIRLRVDLTRPSDQVWNQDEINVHFRDRFVPVEYAFTTMGEAAQQHCATSPQCVRVASTTLTCHPEGIFTHRIYRNEDGSVNEQSIDNILPSLDARLTSFCVTPCHRFLFAINVQQEYDNRAYDEEFDEVWKCRKFAIVSDDSSLVNLARRTIVESMDENAKKDETYSDVLHDSPRLAKKLLGSSTKQ